MVGLAGYLNQPHDQDQLERSAPLQPQLRAIDAYNAQEALVAWLRGFGVTTIHTGHGPGALVSGQTMVAKTRGATVEEAVVLPLAMIAANLGPAALAEKEKSPGTRAKQMAMLRSALIRADEYRQKLAAAKEGERPSRDLELEALASVLDRKTPLLVTVNRSQDIVSALRLAAEFAIRIVLDGAAESYLLVDEIRRAGVPVILHPTMARSFDERENLSFETAARLKAAGIPFALQSGYEGYVPKTRVVLFEAGLAAANGLAFNDALAAITIEAARILGVDGRVGSLAEGKDGDVALFDGDPFEYTTHVTGVVIEGDAGERQAQMITAPGRPRPASPPLPPARPAAETTAVKLSVVVPVYNERYLVRDLLARVLAVEDPCLAELEVVVVDDGSTDGTREILRQLAAGEPRLRYFEHAHNQGKGAAVRTGIAAATGDLTLFQDADLEYDPRDYPRLVRPFLEDGADVVYGSRFLAADRRRVLHYRHARINRFLTGMSNFFTDLDLTDMETCYKVFRTELLKSIPLRSNDFALEPEITAKIAKRGFRIFEVPISYLGRTYLEGKKIGWRDGLKAIAHDDPLLAGRRRLRPRRIRLAHPHQPRESAAVQPLDGGRGPPACRRPGARDRRRHRQHHRLAPAARQLGGERHQSQLPPLPAEPHDGEALPRGRERSTSSAARISPPCAAASTP